MKKFFVLALLSYFVPLVSLFMGSPTEPAHVDRGPLLPEDSLFSMKVGYEVDIVLENKLKSYGTLEGAPVDVFEYVLNQGVFTLGLFDRAEIYASAGAMSAGFTYTTDLFRELVQSGTKDQFTWGTGGRVILWQWGNLGLGMQGCYQWANLHLAPYSIQGLATPGHHAKLIYNAWQACLATSYRIGFFVPYLGFKGTQTKVRFYNLNPIIHHIFGQFRMRNRTWAGLVLGCALVADKGFDLTVEADLFDQVAYTVFGNMRF